MYILDKIATQIKKNSQDLAVVDDFGSLTYGELDNISQEITQDLKLKGILPGDVIAIEIEQSRFLIPALVGILRAEAVCLPLHPIFPPERCEYMVSQSGAKGYLRFIDNQYSFISIHSDISNSKVQSSKLAYILYTSGSTGKPKGVAMTTKSLSKLIEWHLNLEKNELNTKTAQFAPITFDVSFQEIFSTLYLGGTLFIVPEKIKRDPPELLRYLSRNSIERVFLPTAILDILAESALQMDEDLKLGNVFVAGEQLRITTNIRSWFKKLLSCRLHNHYGPTETHVVTSYTFPKDVSKWEDLPPIGKTLPHVKAHVLDSDMGEVTPGTEGELYIEGDCLAEGYINQPELTSQRFISFPDVKVEKLYKTGDIVVENNGLLYFKGRADGQVKFNGYRIETGEVEVVLSRHPKLKSAFICVDNNDKQNARLVAYVVQKSNYEPTGKELVLEKSYFFEWQEYLKKYLPAYMIPSVWIKANYLPLNQNGKIDKSLLLPILRKRPDMQTPYSGPSTKAEKEICQIWQDVLGLDFVGVNDNFFDLGGNSLMAVRVMQQINSLMNLELPIISIYANPSVKQLADSTLPSKVLVHCQSKGLVDSSTEAVAIIGIACRFPGADTPEDFWNNLVGGIESITHFDEVKDMTEGRFISSAGVLEGVQLFDSSFFGFSSSQGELLDPQHRIFLECVWEAMEDASVVPNSNDNKVGLFGGCGPSSYLINNIHSSRWRSDRTLLDSTSEMEILLGNDKDFLTSRAAYLMNFQGPVCNVNAACATSLYAVHYAIKSLRENSCDVAVAGAVCIPSPQLSGYFYEPSMPFSKDGHCRPFDEKASGTVFGSGCGVIVLKRLKDAIAQGNPIYALLRGTSINNDGSNKVGITAPSLIGQTRVIQDALLDAGLSKKDVSYVETHGTATEVGDLIEFTALKNALQTPESCGIGSVKSNIGHLGWAAGMAGLIKAALSLYYKKIPPTINFHSPNPALDIKESPFYVVDKIVNLEDSSVPYNFGVSAFGLGGCNAHVILEEGPRIKKEKLSKKQYSVIPLSARSSSALNDLSRSYASYLQNNRDISLDSIFRTASLGRTHHHVRKAIVASDRDDFLVKLQNIAPSEENESLYSSYSEPISLVGLFGGHGTEYVGAGYDLYKGDSFFRSTLQGFNPQLKDLIGQTIENILYPDQARGSELTDVISVHVANFIIQNAMYKYWKKLGFNFSCFLGHSLGEYAAACAAGVFSEQDALSVIISRAKAISKLPPNGRMGVIFANEQSVSEIIQKLSLNVEIAVVNGIRNTVISGHEKDMSRALTSFAETGYKVKKITSLRAGHCYLMDPILDEVEAAFDNITFNYPESEIISNLTGKQIGNEICTPQYWKRHLRETVQFYDCFLSTQKTETRGFIEFSGSPTLLSLGQAILSDHPGPWVPSLRKNASDTLTIAKGVSELYEKGFMPDWKQLCNEKSSFTHLPTYPFQRKKVWIEPKPRVKTDKNYKSEQRETLWKDWVYKVDWEDIGQNLSPKQSKHKWLIISNNNIYCETFINELNKNSISYVLANTGDGCQLESPIGSTINPLDENQILKLLTDIEEPFENIVVLTALDLSLPSIEIDQDLSEELKPILSLAMFLVRNISNKEHRLPPRVWFVTKGAKSVIPGDNISFLQTALWGMRKVIEVEKPLLKTTCIDVSPGDKNYIPHLVRVILCSPPETEIALRGDKTLSACLKPFKENTKKFTLSDSGAYLITGGLGGLGLWTAKNFVSGGARHLILVGRSAPSSKSQEIVKELESQGARIDISSLDISCGEDVTEFFKCLKNDKVNLKGIVHCAGAIEDKLIDNIEWSDFVSVLKPKAQGAWNIHRASEIFSYSLDFFTLFSSATSLVGNFGQVNYAVANSLVDGLAEYRYSHNCPAVSIHWGVWSGVGGVANRPGLLKHLEFQGMGYIDPANGADALMHYMNTTTPEVGILPNQWDIFLKLFGLEQSHFYKYIGSISKSYICDKNESLIFRLYNAVAEERKSILEEYLLREVQKFIVSDVIITVNDQFRQLGLDSLSLIQLRNSLQKALKCQLPPELIARYPNIAELSRFLLGELIDFEEQPESIVQKFDEKSKVDDFASLKENIPLSIQQKRWLKLIREVNYGQRVVPVIFYTELNSDIFYSSVLKLLERHDLLCYIYSDNGAKILAPEECLLSKDEFFTDFSQLSDTDKAQEIEKCVAKMSNQFPDPYHKPSWLLRCIKLESKKFSLLVGAQHLEFDGSGLSVFIHELREIYKAAKEDRVPDTLQEPVQYHQYVAQQQDYLKSHIAVDRAYFEGLFSPLYETTKLPNYNAQSITVASHSHRYTPENPLGNWDDIQYVAEFHGVSGFSLILASYAILISRVINSGNIVISIIRSGRTDKAFSQTLGPFTMPFPIPVYLAGQSAIQLLKQCNQTVSQITSRADYPSTDLINYVPAFCDLPFDTYFSDTSINFTNYRRNEEDGDPKVEIIEVLGKVSHSEFKYCNFKDLRRIPGFHLVVAVKNKILEGNYWYHSDRFSEEQVVTWVEEHRVILGELVQELKKAMSMNENVKKRRKFA